MERMIYEPTDRQIAEWNRPVSLEVPTDEEFKAAWAKRHHGRTTGWGMEKRDWMLRAMKVNPEYQRGLWQGRVDAARELEYSEERSESAYNLGYHRGYTEFWSNYRGWDAKTKSEFAAKYMSDEK